MKSVVLRGCIVLGLAAVVLAGGTFAAPDAQAQDGDQCAAFVAEKLASAQGACSATGPGQVCAGTSGVLATASGAGEALPATVGEALALADLSALATAPGDLAADEWGVAMLTFPGGPEGDPSVTGVLYGDAAIARPAAVETDRPTMTVTNSGGATANLRAGAGTTYAVAGQLEPGQSAVADGRNQQGDWIRIQIDGAAAWVFARLVTWDGDLNSLDVLLPDDVSTPFESGTPFQAFTLTTGEAPGGCPAAGSGLLLQYSGEAAANLQINGVELDFSSASLLVTAAPNNALDVMVLDGAATVTARGIPRDVAAGGAARVSLAGEDGLTPTAAPVAADSFAFAQAAAAPLSALPGSLVCWAGVADPAARVVLRVGPGEQRGTLSNMSPNAIYRVEGWANDGEGAPWWQLDTGAQKSWVAQAETRTLGACDAVAQADAPPLVFAPPSAPAGGEGAVDSVGDFAPTGNSVWQMIPGSDNMTGECSGAPAINFCDHLAAISPASGGIMWKGMETSGYYLQRLQPNVYSYAGPNALGTGTISMTLTFTGESTVRMTQRLTLSSEPNCQHVYFYTGTRNW